MPRGGRREGGGLKPRHIRYLGNNRHSRIGFRALKIGQRCEVLWRASYKTNFAGMHWIGERRPRAHKKIVRQVAEEFGETHRMVERLWEDYRRLEADMNKDLPL